MPTPPPRRKHTALYVRLPTAEASKLDRAAFELGAAKQDLVTGLIASYVDPATASGLEALGALLGVARELKEEQERDKPPFGFADRRRVIVESEPEGLTVGRHDFRAGGPDVLTIAEAAELLKVEEGVVAKLAAAGELPGRELGGEWRFARRALLGWLGAGAEAGGGAEGAGGAAEVHGGEGPD